MIIVVNIRLSYYSYCYNYLLFLIQLRNRTEDAWMDGGGNIYKKPEKGCKGWGIGILYILIVCTVGMYGIL